jgi:hypothetical protein
MPEAQTDPVGYADGEARVTRGGSHSADGRYLRSASRMAALPQEHSWMIGFRVALGELPATAGLDRPAPARYAREVCQRPICWQRVDKPVFYGPMPYIHRPDDGTPFYQHYHCPSIVWCDNGDLLAIWFFCQTEAGREMTILASRLRAGAQEWDKPSEFFSVADRNTTGSSLHISYDEGRTWIDYGHGMPDPVFEEGRSGGWIAGIHAGVAALDDGRLLALGRGNSIGGRMPMSLSADGGRIWTYHASSFAPISSGQRLVLKRLMEGPLLLISFTDTAEAYGKRSDGSA